MLLLRGCQGWQLVQKDLSKAQQQQKRWYDNNACSREFNPGNQVMVLLLSSTYKLWAQWQGSYQIKRQIGKVDYEMDVWQKKRKGVKHVNMPKEWVSPVVNTSYFVGCEAEELEEDGTVLLQEEDQDNEGNLCTGKHLDGRQLRELQDLLNKYSNVKQSKPVKTSPSRAQHWDRGCKTSKTTTIQLASCLTKMKCSRNWSRWRRTV